MKQGIRNVQELYRELEEQRENRKDIIADTRSLMVTSTEEKSTLHVTAGGENLHYVISDVAHRQIADRLGIPFKYYTRMRTEFPELLDEPIETPIDVENACGKPQTFVIDDERETKEDI